jgi:phage-related baseplate assembly protein
MSRYAAIDLSRLPPPDVIETLDYEGILDRMLGELKAALAEVLPDWDRTLESDPLVILCQRWAYSELLLRARVNDAARAVMLAHAGGTDLDHLVALVGTARRPDETDAELRVRAQIAWEALSTAGPEGAYRYHALSADTRVRDVAIDSPTPGTVRVTVLARDGDGAAPADLVESVRAYLSADDRRPLTDTVEVRPADVVTYTVAATLHIYPGPAAAPVLAAAETAARQTVARLHALGHDVTLSALYAALHQPGVQRVDLHSPPADIIVDPGQAAWCADVEIAEGARDA